VLGPTAFGAVRYAVPDGAETTLSLQILNRPTSTPGGADPTAGVKIIACMITTPGWASVQNDRYDQAPKYDAAGCSVGEISSDTLTFTLSSSMVENGMLDLAIVPSFGGCPPSPVEAPVTTPPPPGEAALVPVPKCDHPYQIALAKPTNSSLYLDSVPEDEEALALDEFDEGSFEDPLLEFEESFDDALDPDSAFASFDFEGGVGDDFYGSVSGAPVARPQVGRAIPASGFRNPFRPDASRGERLLAVSLLLAMGGALWWFGGQQLRAPRLLGSLGAAAFPADDGERERRGNGGIGRFARPRGGLRPPRLF
jgi:hypothetical protein